MTSCGSGGGKLRDDQVSKTLVDELIGTADDLRALHTEFGGRPYRVFLVWVGWTRDVDGDGAPRNDELLLDPDSVGVGRPVLLREMEILPRPEISGLAGRRFDATGTTEAGTITVGEVSMSFPEEALTGLIPDFRDPKFPSSLKPGVEFWWEVQEDRPPGYRKLGTAGAQAPIDLRGPRRRYHLDGVPSRSKPYTFAWDPIQLVRADGERGRNGQVSVVPG